MDPAALYRTPNALAPHYSRSRVSERLLLTGHSHQAWPDVGFDGQAGAWLDTARYLDDKWEHALRRAERVRAGFGELLGDTGGGIALAGSTHDLLVRLLSALPLRT
ncbi:MAG: kynureninase, partial [Gemmatimonadales bacterium]